MTKAMLSYLHISASMQFTWQEELVKYKPLYPNREMYVQKAFYITTDNASMTVEVVQSLLISRIRPVNKIVVPGNGGS